MPTKPTVTGHMGRKRDEADYERSAGDPADWTGQSRGRGSRRRTERCTEFLISDDLVVTNFHCIATSSDAANTWVDFGYDRKNAKFETFKVSKLEVTNYEEGFDYAVLRVAGAPGKKYGHINVPGGIPNAFVGSPTALLLIEHPGGGPKMVSIIECQVSADSIAGVDATRMSDIGHHCDTLAGSSGSPVFASASHQLRGLHHLGFEDTERKGPLQNQSVYIGYLVSDMEAQSSPVLSEIHKAGQ